MGRFRTSINADRKQHGDVISGVALDYVPASFGDSMLNSGRIIRHFFPTGPVLRTFVQCVIAFSSRSETGSDVISGLFVRPIVLDKCLKFCDSSLNDFREIPPEAV